MRGDPRSHARAARLQSDLQAPSLRTPPAPSTAGDPDLEEHTPVHRARTGSRPGAPAFPPAARLSPQGPPQSSGPAAGTPRPRRPRPTCHLLDSRGKGSEDLTPARLWAATRPRPGPPRASVCPASWACRGARRLGVRAPGHRRSPGEMEAQRAAFGNRKASRVRADRELSPSLPRHRHEALHVGGSSQRHREVGSTASPGPSLPRAPPRRALFSPLNYPPLPRADLQQALWETVKQPEGVWVYICIFHPGRVSAKTPSRVSRGHR